MNDNSASVAQSKNGHSWRFFRAGGVDQVLIRSGADIAHLPDLDLKLWFALAMPVEGISIDRATLTLLDSDHDGRIRPPEIIQAVRWAQDAFENLDDLLKGGDCVRIDAIKSEAIRRSAQNILKALGKAPEPAVTLADVSRMEAVLAGMRLNGDGVVPPESAEDAALAAAMTDIAGTAGTVPDRSGKAGINVAKLDVFFSQAEAFCAWCDIADKEPAILPYGEATREAAAAIAAVRAKVDDYFARVKLAAYDPRCAESMNRPLTEYAALAAGDISAAATECESFPLACVGKAALLPLASGINPAWAGRIGAFQAKTASLVLGRSVEFLDETTWLAIKAALAPYDAWMQTKPQTAVEKLGRARLVELIGGGFRERIAALIADDDALRPEFEKTCDVEKLVRFQRDFVAILSNLINFSQFYQKKGAAFISGNLYLDARNCHICLDVTDAAAHASLAGLAGMYLAYCEVKRPSGQKKTIVAAFTDGDSDNLMVGRNGVFFDREGNDWDARITKIITNPISLREAFWSPYKKLQRFLDEFIAKRAANSDGAVGQKLSGTAEWAASTGSANSAAALPGKKIDVGTVAALGVALGAIGATLSALATGLMGLSWWQLPFVFAGIILLISLPSVVMASLKLKRRNMAPVLDANGWAVNTRARINAPFGAAMTDTARVPAKLAGRLMDPFAEKKSHWRVYVVIALLVMAAIWVLDGLGKLYEWTDGVIGTEPKTPSRMSPPSGEASQPPQAVANPQDAPQN